MSNRMLTVLVIFFALVLGFILFVSDHSISQLLEACGQFISEAFGF